jgi:hypothetical protein
MKSKLESGSESIKTVSTFASKLPVLVVLSALLLFATRPAQAQSEVVLYNFTGGLDGAQPEASLTFHNGNLYGTTETVGILGYGVVFELSPNGSGGWNQTVLHEFAFGEIPPQDGGFPTSSPNPSIKGQAVTFTAVVTSSNGVPPNGETVSFTNGKTVFGTGTLSAGSASFTTSALKVGTTVVTAEYVGDFNFAPSTSNPAEQVVNKKKN